MMLAEFRAAEHSFDAIDLIVRNAGASVAHDVRVTFDPPLTAPEDEGVTRYLIERYRDPIPTIAPGQELANVWFTGRPDRDHPDGMRNAEPTPDSVVVSISYRGSGQAQFRDLFPLTTDLVKMTTFSHSSDSIPGRIKSMQQALVSIDRSMKEVALGSRYVRREEIDQERAALHERVERLRARSEPRNDEEPEPPGSPA